jgi:hypothetical protein
LAGLCCRLFRDGVRAPRLTTNGYVFQKTTF